MIFKFLKKGKKPKHSHYKKDVRKYKFIDIYALGFIFEIDDPSGAILHAVKKLLMSGKRGAKSRLTDLSEARDTIDRLIELETMLASEKDAR